MYVYQVYTIAPTVFHKAFSFQATKKLTSSDHGAEGMLLSAADSTLCL